MTCEIQSFIDRTVYKDVDLFSLARIRNLTLASLGFVSRAAAQIVNLVVALFASHFISPAEFGQFAIALAIAMFMHTMSYSGVYDQLIRERDDELDKDTAFWLMLGYSVAGAGMFIALAVPLESAFKSPGLARIIFWMMAIQPLAGISAWTQALMLREHKTDLYYALNILVYGITLVAAIVALFLLRNLDALIVYRWVSVGSMAILFWAVRPILPRSRFDMHVARRIFGASGALYGSRALNFVYSYGADFILGFLFTPAATGIYRFAVRIGNGVADVVNQPLRTFAWLTLAHKWREQQPMEKQVRQFMSMSAVLLSAAIGSVVGIANIGIGLLLKPEWQAVIPVLYGVAAARILGVTDLIVEPVLGTRGKSVLLLRYRSIATAALLTTAAAVAVGGAAAVAWGQAGVTLAFGLIGVHLIARELGTSRLRLAMAGFAPLGFGFAVLAVTLFANMVAPHLLASNWGRVSLSAGTAAAATCGALILAWRFRLVNVSLLRGR